MEPVALLIVAGVVIDLLVVIKLASAYRTLRQRERLTKPPKKASKTIMMTKYNTNSILG
jgi:hypothetical protein